MSFIVSFKGQFQPYTLPDLSHYDRVRHIYKSKETNKVDESSLQESKNDPQKRSNKQVSQLKQYQKQEKSAHLNKKKFFARDLMHSPVICANLNQSMQEAISLMDKYKIRHLPILNTEQVLVGILSDRDILNSNANTSIEENMSPEVLTAMDSTNVKDLARIMLHEKYSALPIIDLNHRLVGIVTQSDILNFVIHQLPIDEII